MGAVFKSVKCVAANYCTLQSQSSSGWQDPSMGPNNKEILCSPKAPIKTFRLIPCVIRGWRRKC